MSPGQSDLAASKQLEVIDIRNKFAEKKSTIYELVPRNRLIISNTEILNRWDAFWYQDLETVIPGLEIVSKLQNLPN